MTPLSVHRHNPYSVIATFADGLSAIWDETVEQEWEPYDGDLRRNSVPFAHLQRRSDGSWWVAPATTGRKSNVSEREARFEGKVTWRPADMRLLDVPTDAGIVEAAEAAIELLTEKQKGEAATPRPS